MRIHADGEQKRGVERIPLPLPAQEHAAHLVGKRGLLPGPDNGLHDFVGRRRVRVAADERCAIRAFITGTGYALHSGSEEEWAGARPDSRPQTGVKQLQTVHATVDTQALTLSAPQSACPWKQRRPSGSRPSRRMRQDLYLTRSDPGTSRAVCAQTRPQPESSAYPVCSILCSLWSRMYVSPSTPTTTAQAPIHRNHFFADLCRILRAVSAIASRVTPRPTATEANIAHLSSRDSDRPIAAASMPYESGDSLNQVVDRMLDRHERVMHSVMLITVIMLGLRVLLKLWVWIRDRDNCNRVLLGSKSRS